MLCGVLVLLAGCSHRMQCFSPPEHATTTRCAAGPILELADLEARGPGLVGTTVLVAGPLSTDASWCQDCCSSTGRELALGGGKGPVLALGGLWCRRGTAPEQETCPLPPDGRRIVVRGTLDRARSAASGEWYLRQTEVCQ